jgi:hypothetical protein
MMKTSLIVQLAALSIVLGSGTGPVWGAGEEKLIETQWGGKAEIAYETGFAHRVRRHAEGGVSLFDMELIENDAPGAGQSEKGISSDIVWGPYQARKVLQLEDARTRKAYAVIFTNSVKPPHPLTFRINGHEGRITKDNSETYRWAEFPANVLKRGDNVIDFSCSQAKSESEGWDLYLARADEFESGGGDPAHVGKTSFVSEDGGKTWKQSPFGPDGKTRAEYTIRLSLDRYVSSGTLETPVIDLWRGDNTDFIVPLRRVATVTVEAEAETPKGTRMAYFMRRGTNPSPYAEDWSEYEPIGSGAALRKEIGGLTSRYKEQTFNRRYVQVKAALSTADPRVSPIVRTMRVKAKVEDTVPPLTNVFVRECENPEMRYPSVDWQWESWDRPEFAELRKRQNLDEVVAGSRTQFQAQVKLMDHTSKFWLHEDPIPGYPGWDALSILNRVDDTGGGGMCIQSNNFLAGLCMVFGWQARLVNITAHETCEVWNDDYGKWVYLDGHLVNHYAHDAKTGEPLSILDLHRRFMDKYYADEPIDWMTSAMNKSDKPEEFSVGLGVPGQRMPSHCGVTLAAFARMVPRNNWYAKPFPRPLSHGTTWWPWDGYINWYDERTPPKRQYSWHTDREQDMWPALNRVRVHASSAFGNDRLFLRFETYTPNFSHYEVQVEESAWREVADRWVWLLQSGPNRLRVRAVNQLGAGGKPTVIRLNRTDVAP